jgi:hypothetical protein
VVVVEHIVSVQKKSQRSQHNTLTRNQLLRNPTVVTIDGAPVERTSIAVSRSGLGILNRTNESFG